MRVTNFMTQNRLLLNVNRNARLVDSLYMQYGTGKKIQMASEDPILASRALKFRTNVSETEQYMKNTAQGISWMEITEQGFINLDKAMASIRDKCVMGATDSYEWSDRKKIIEEIQAYYDQIGLEMNISYAGRYVFSGYRTDEPPTINESSPALAYTDITQSFTASDIDNTMAYTKKGADAPVVTTINKLNIAYNNAETPSSIQLGTHQTTPPYAFVPSTNPTAAIPAVIKIPTDAEIAASPAIDQPAMQALKDRAYNPAAGEVYFIAETGEIILGSDAMTAISANPNDVIQVVYDKTGFDKGDLNPKVYFTCTDANGTYDMNKQNIEYEFGANTRIGINTLAKDSYTAQLHGDLKNIIDLIKGIEVTSDAQLQDKYSKPPYNLSGTELEEMVEKQKEDEIKEYRGVIQKAFSNMLDKSDRHNSQISKEFTDLGSRMNRLDMISSRLTEDRVSYRKLMSENEDIDYVDTAMHLQTAEYIYQASLKSGGSIVQQSLVDFIR